MSPPAADQSFSEWSAADGVVFISGIARGQGRAHALRFAELGASVAGCDLCEDLATVPYPLGTEADLESVQACLPSILARGRGGSIVFTSSIGGMQGLLQCPHDVASKHGVIGLLRALANELGQRGVRVNAVCPTNVDTAMIQNAANYRTFRPDLESPVREDIIAPATAMHILPTPWVQPEDVSDAVVWLASRAARYVTAAVLPVDAGATAKVSN